MLQIVEIRHSGLHTFRPQWGHIPKSFHWKWKTLTKQRCCKHTRCHILVDRLLPFIKLNWHLVRACHKYKTWLFMSNRTPEQMIHPTSLRHLYNIAIIGTKLYGWLKVWKAFLFGIQLGNNVETSLWQENKWANSPGGHAALEIHAIDDHDDKYWICFVAPSNGLVIKSGLPTSSILLATTWKISEMNICYPNKRINLYHFLLIKQFRGI